MKIKCCTCKNYKEFTEFHKNKRTKNGYAYSCKECVSIYGKEHKNSIRKNKRIYIFKNAKEISFKKGLYYEKNKESILEQKRQYYLKNKEKIAASRNKSLDKTNRNRRIKRRNNDMSRLKDNMRRRINKYFSDKRYIKNDNTEKILGNSFNSILDYLNKNEYGFKYTDDGIDVDHIIPLSSAKTKCELIILFNYSNLQLLPSYYNKHIKRNKKWNEEHFKLWLSKNNINKNNNII